MRYIVFAYNRYYPKGGWGDVKQLTKELSDAVRHGAELQELYDYVEIVDLTTQSMIVNNLYSRISTPKDV
jgi:hypothetical protein